MTQPTAFTQDFEQLYPFERMSYVFGQLLGVREFRQDQAYFLNKQRLHNRNLHGVGVLWGLDVLITPEGLIQVTPGLALDTQGREIYVDSTQSASLQSWLDAPVSDTDATTNLAALQANPPADGIFTVYVTLAHRTCDTELQAILGQPCRVDTGTGGVLQPTRIRDDFLLNLSATPPVQHEELFMQRLGQRLPLIQADGGVELLDLSQPKHLRVLEEQIKGFWDKILLDAAADKFLIHPDNLNDFVRGLFRYWVTTVRPELDYLHPIIVRLLNNLQVDEGANAADIAGTTAVLTGLIDEYLRTGDLTLITNALTTTVTGADAAQIRQGVIAHWKTKPQSKVEVEDPNLIVAAIRFTHDGTTLALDSITADHRQRPVLWPARLMQELIQFTFTRG